jgi:hypothetical protein
MGLITPDVGGDQLLIPKGSNNEEDAESEMVLDGGRVCVQLG